MNHQMASMGRDVGPMDCLGYSPNRPTSNTNSHFAYSIDNKYMFTELGVQRTFQMPKVITESLSSGFASSQDTLDRDLELLHFATCSIPSYGFFTGPNNSGKAIRNISPQSYQSRVSPSNLFTLDTFNQPQPPPRVEQLLDIHSQQFNSGWDLQRNHTESHFNNQPEYLLPNGFNIEDVFVKQVTPENIDLLQPAKPEFDMHIVCNPQTNLEGNKLIDQTLGFLCEPPRATQNSLGYSVFNGFAETNTVLNTSVEHLQTGQLLTEESALDKQICDYSTFPNLCSVGLGTNLSNYNSCSNQNMLVRINTNGQMQLASIDQNYLQQIFNSNVQQNYGIGQTLNESNGQLATTALNSQQSIIYTNDNRSNSIIQKITEPIDLMENPGNWRRLPNNGGYQCNICSKCYTRKYGLKIHLRIHSGFKPLECKVCKKKFGDPSNMAKHIRLHSTDGSPYKCTLCNKPLVRRRDLERHMRSRHPNSPLQSNPELSRRIDTPKL